jgi:hypothetical protein
MVNSGDVDRIIKEISPYYQKEGFMLESKNNLIYNSPAESLEPVYFWLTTFMRDKEFDNDPVKLIDNFASSVGSGHFSEMGGKKSAMQEQASKLMQTINAILRSVLNLIYDLKEFKIRLSHYNAAKSKNKATKEAGVLALKQIWLDKVDIQRGQGSINALSSGNLQFVTLRDAFYAAKNPDDVDKLDLNERVKRLLKPRILEFKEWKKRSEQELRKRFEVEKAYLKSQVSALKLQTRWARPYLVAAKRLEADEKLEEKYALVSAFNTVIIQVVVLGQKPVKVKVKHTPNLKGGRALPEEFGYMQEKGKIRKYFSVVIMDFNFTGIPSKQGQHFSFGGKTDVKTMGYALNQDEIDLLKYKLKEEDLENAFGLIEGMTKDSIEALHLDVDELLEDNSDEEKDSPDTNPFTAIFTAAKAKKKEKTPEEKEKAEIKKMKKLAKEGIRPDSYAEKYVRNVALETGMNFAFTLFDNFKKSMGMAAFPFGGKKGFGLGVAAPPNSRAEELFGFNPGIQGSDFS